MTKLNKVYKTAEDLADSGLPDRSVVIDYEGDAWQLLGGFWTCAAEGDVELESAFAPFTLVHVGKD